jgi:Protein of unknown function (DUF3732)
MTFQPCLYFGPLESLMALACFSQNGISRRRAILCIHLVTSAFLSLAIPRVLASLIMVGFSP